MHAALLPHVGQSGRQLCVCQGSQSVGAPPSFFATAMRLFSSRSTLLGSPLWSANIGKQLKCRQPAAPRLWWSYNRGAENAQSAKQSRREYRQTLQDAADVLDIFSLNDEALGDDVANT